MKQYELNYLITVELKTEDVEKLNSDINETIQQAGGTILKIEGPVPKTLSYQIKKQGSALWVDLEFSLEPEKLKEIEEKVRKNPNIIRYLLVIKKPASQKIRKTRTAPIQDIPVKDAVKEPEEKEKKVELKDIDEKLEEILKE